MPMKKMYRVFVSSTYEDLKEERIAVMRTLVSMGCLPVGMELSPASNNTQQAEIQNLITTCDYYVLVMAGRYGSIIPDGTISYTEWEYELAKHAGIPILAFLHEDINKLPHGKVDTKQKQLQKFRKKVDAERYRKTWGNKDELAREVMNSLHLCFKNSPASGYAYGNDLETSVILTNNFDFREVSDKMMAAEETYVFALGCTVTMPLLKDRTTNLSQEKQPKFKFLLMQPDGDAVKLAAMRANVEIEDMINTYKVNMKKVMSIPNSECRTMDYLPPYNMFIFNPNNEDSEMIVHVAGWNTPSENSRPALRIHKKEHKAWFGYFLDQFNKMWKFAEEKNGEKENDNTNN